MPGFLLSAGKHEMSFDDPGDVSQERASQEAVDVDELIFLKIYNQRENQSLEPKYENYRTAEKYVKRIESLRFLGKFHDLLQISSSHYAHDENASERLMLKYYKVRSILVL